MEETLLLLWLSLWVWDTSEWEGPQGNFPLKNDLQASAFKQCVALNTQEAGKAISLGGRKDIHSECVFRPLSCTNCIASQTADLQACFEGLCYRVRPMCHPALTKPCKHIPRSQRYRPWESSVWECVENAGCQTVVTSSRSPRTSKGLQERSWGPPLASEIPKGEQS